MIDVNKNDIIFAKNILSIVDKNIIIQKTQNNYNKNIYDEFIFFTNESHYLYGHEYNKTARIIINYDIDLTIKFISCDDCKIKCYIKFKNYILKMKKGCNQNIKYYFCNKSYGNEEYNRNIENFVNVMDIINSELKHYGLFYINISIILSIISANTV